MTGKGWREKLRSPEVEARLSVVAVFIPVVVLVYLVVAWMPLLDWSVAWPPLVGCAVVCLAASAGLAALFVRWRPRFLKDLRERCRDMHWGVVGFFIGTFFLAVPVTAPAFAETWVCERGDPVTIQTSWTETDPDSGTKHGTYEVDGESYPIVIAAEHWIKRQVAAPIPPTADNEFYTRTYRVPWVGSERVCGTADSSDGNTTAGLATGGILYAVPGWIGVAELWRRRRNDESVPLDRSVPA